MSDIEKFKKAVAGGDADAYRIGNDILRDDPNEGHKQLVHFVDAWCRFGLNRVGLWLVERPALRARFA